MKINWKNMVKKGQESKDALESQQGEENGAKSEPKKAESKKKGSKKRKEDDLKEELTKLQVEVDEAKDKYLRLFAEFDNYKKRSIKEKLDFMRTASQETISSILPVLDDFDRAKKSADDESSTEQFSEGVTMVYNKLNSIVGNLGLQEMESTGKVFDPELHEAITEIPAPTEDMKGKIIDTVEKGYLLKEKIIRHAKVVVGK